MELPAPGDDDHGLIINQFPLRVRAAIERGETRRLMGDGVRESHPMRARSHRFDARIETPIPAPVNAPGHRDRANDEVWCHSRSHC